MLFYISMAVTYGRKLIDGMKEKNSHPLKPTALEGWDFYIDDSGRMFEMNEEDQREEYREMIEQGEQEKSQPYTLLEGWDYYYDNFGKLRWRTEEERREEYEGELELRRMYA